MAQMGAHMGSGLLYIFLEELTTPIRNDCLIASQKVRSFEILRCKIYHSQKSIYIILPLFIIWNSSIQTRDLNAKIFNFAPLTRTSKYFQTREAFNPNLKSRRKYGTCVAFRYHLGSAVRRFMGSRNFDRNHIKWRPVRSLFQRRQIGSHGRLDH